MSERYQRLFSLPENLYSEGAPVLVSKGALLKDTQTGQILSQLKLRNINAKTIKAVTVRIELLDTVGRSLDSITEYQFLDLSAGRDDFFGEKTPIYLDNGSARSFSVSVKEVIFEDNSIWSGKENAKWETLPEAKERFKFTADHELEKQFVLHYGKDWKFNAERVVDLWYCACGALNRAEETECHSCSRTFDQCESIDVEALKAEKDDRVEKERANAEFERLAVEKAKKSKAKALITISTITAVIVLIVLTVKVFIPLSKYNSAVKLYESGRYDEAIAAFKNMDGYKDSEEKIIECQNGIQYDSAAKLFEDGKYQEAIAAFEEIGEYKDSKERIETCKTAISTQNYEKAVKLYEEGKYEEAIEAFKALNGYKDSEEQIKECKYQDALRQYNVKNYKAAAPKFSSISDFKDSKELCYKCWDQFAYRETVSTDGYLSLGLRSDGKVMAAGYNGFGQCDGSDWTDIVAVSAGDVHSLGLKSDGTVFSTKVTVFDADYGQTHVSSWTDIVAISAGNSHSLGLRSDGTVVSAGYNNNGQCDVSDWTDIVAISAGSDHSLGLRSDGTVVATEIIRPRDFGQGDVSGWTDIVAVSAGSSHSLGLRSDGTVVATGHNDDGECNVSGWTDIVAISAGFEHSLGLRSDGTVVATGDNDYSQCDVSDWRNIKLPNR